MSKQDVVQSHVETLLEQMLETEDLQVSPTGEIPIAFCSAAYSVRVLPAAGRPHVEVFARAVEDVDADPGLYEALNAINRRTSHVRTFWTERTVIFAAELLGETLEYDEIACTCSEIATLAHLEGTRLAAIYGGQVATPDYVDEEDE